MDMNKYIFDNIEILEKKFTSRAIKNEGMCWDWNGSKSGIYPMISHGYALGAHRISWSIKNGLIPPDKFVLHICDNTICTNPEHLIIGTQSDNMRYKSQKNKPNFINNKEINTKGLNIMIPMKLHAEIKSRSAMRNISIRTWVVRAIIQAIKNEEVYEK